MTHTDSIAHEIDLNKKNTGYETNKNLVMDGTIITTYSLHGLTHVVPGVELLLLPPHACTDVLANKV